MSFVTDISKTEQAPAQCAQCGGYLPDGESCADRFNILLALDHSRQEPWGSRHGPAFATYTLQHSAGIKTEVLQNAWLMLSRVYEHGDARQNVVDGMRATYRGRHDATYSSDNRKFQQAWTASTLPVRESPPNHFSVTIVDLGDFPADSYATQLDAWCLATMHAWKSTDKQCAASG